MSAEDRTRLKVRDEAELESENELEAQDQESSDEAEIDIPEESGVDSVTEPEAQGTAVIIAATAAALEKQFDTERARDKEEYDRRLAEQQEKHEAHMKEIQEKHISDMEAIEKTHQTQIDQLKAEYEKRIDELRQNNLSIETASVGYPDDMIDVEYVQDAQGVVEDPEATKKRDEKLYNGAVKGKDGKFASVKEYPADEKRQEKTSKKTEKSMMLDSELVSYELDNGLRLGCPKSFRNKQEIVDAISVIVNSKEAQRHDLGWLEGEIRKIIKKLRKSYKRKDLAQVRLLQPKTKKEV